MCKPVTAVFSMAFLMVLTAENHQVLYVNVEMMYCALEPLN